MTDFAAARRHMVDGQVRTADVTDLRLITAMLEVPRERFVPPADRRSPISISTCRWAAGPPPAQADGAGQADPGRRSCRRPTACSMSAAPPAMRAAVLARIAGQVVALEQDAGLAKAAAAALVVAAQCRRGHRHARRRLAAGAPYDVIVLEGATEVVPQALCRQLKDGGRLVCVLGAGPGAKAMLYRRSGEEVGGRPIFDAAAALLPGFAKTPVFAF